MPIAVPPPSPPVAACIKQATSRYGVSDLLLRAVLNVEGGARGTVHRNKNGSQDLGWAQINSTWLPKLSKYGITRNDLLQDPCINIGVAGWLLRQNYLQYRNWEKAIAAYNAGNHLSKGREYARKVIYIWRALYDKRGSETHDET